MSDSVIFTTGDDPVRVGLVASLNRPGGNATGVSVFAARLGSKRIGLLHEMVPDASPIAILVNPTNPDTEDEAKDIQEAAESATSAATAIARPPAVAISAATASAASDRVKLDPAHIQVEIKVTVRRNVSPSALVTERGADIAQNRAEAFLSIQLPLIPNGKQASTAK